jgi:hypothetical protein
MAATCKWDAQESLLHCGACLDLLAADGWIAT